MDGLLEFRPIDCRLDYDADLNTICRLFDCQSVSTRDCAVFELYTVSGKKRGHVIFDYNSRLSW